MAKKISILIVTYIIVFFIGVIYTNVSHDKEQEKLENKVIYTVTIDAEYINLREEIDLNNKPIKKVYKGEKYQVVEFHEGNTYDWYKVIYEDYKTGWIASGKTTPWVIVEN